jgi:hypothetical protein
LHFAELTFLQMKNHLDVFNSPKQMTIAKFFENKSIKMFLISQLMVNGTLAGKRNAI